MDRSIAIDHKEIEPTVVIDVAHGKCSTGVWSPWGNATGGRQFLKKERNVVIGAAPE
tara:strand:+ start:317 stop:487 length:171 start_codon:yes stop_codon:yes gene_type:complete